MTFHAFGGAEAGAAGNPGSGVYLGNTNDSIVASPGAFPGAYSYQVDPVNGVPVLETYGFHAYLPNAPRFLLVPFMWRFTDTGGQFDDEVSVAELGSTTAGGAFARRIIVDTSEELQILDKDEDQIATTSGAPYVAIDTDYWMLWYVDLREDANSRDILWVWKAGAWDKAIDVTGHGDSGIHAAGGVAGNPIDAITFGSNYGKSLPTQGGPCYYDEMAVQILNRSPNTTPIGSVTTVFKVPSGAGSDNDFDSGSPSYLDVDEIPPDGAATIDQGDANGEQQSYAINDATGGDTPLAIQVIGQAQRSGGGTGTVKTYLLESSTYDYSDQWNHATGYRALRPSSAVAKTYNDVNGSSITESLFNTLEAGVEIVAVEGGQTIDLSQIGLEYMKEGPKAVPGDFPSMAVQTITGKAAGAALGSANPVIW